MPHQPPWPLVDDDRYFCSGSNHAGEIKGLALAGHHIGVSAPELTEVALDELGLLRHAGIKVFVDSGAYSEVVFGPEGPRVVKPISEAEWARRIDLYYSLAFKLRDQLYVVAPDMVGFQTETLARLTRWAGDIRALRQLYVNIIVPVQKGGLSMTAFRRRAERILHTRELIWGIPGHKDATTTEDIVQFVKDLRSESPAPRIHLLGMGVHNRRYGEVLRAAQAVCPDLEVFSDSSRIRALTGRGDGCPRPLTAATDRVKAAGRHATAADWKAAALIEVLHDQRRREVEEARRLGWYDAELLDPEWIPLPRALVGTLDRRPEGTPGRAVLLHLLRADPARFYAALATA